GTTAFWLTRPIPQPTMLAAKAISVGALFVIAPTLVDVGVLALRGTGPYEIGLAIPEMLVTWTWWAAILAALAALTPTFARFALVGTIVTVSVMLLWLGEIVVNLYFKLGRSWANGEQFLALSTSRSLVQWLFCIAVGAAVVLHQYMTRRTRRSAVIAIAGVLLAFGVSTAWPWNVLPGARAARAPWPAPGVTIDVAASHVAEPPPLPGYASDSLQVLGHLRVDGVPQGQAVDTVIGRSDLTYPGEPPVTFTGSERDSMDASLVSRWDLALVQRLVGGVSFLNPE